MGKEKVISALKEFKQNSKSHFNNMYQTMKTNFDFIKNFFTEENINRIEWQDIQKLGEHFYCMMETSIAKARAFGKPNATIESYRKIFTEMINDNISVKEKFDIFTKWNNTKDSNYGKKLLGDSFLSELLAYLSEECFIINGRTWTNLHYFFDDNEIKETKKFIKDGNDYIELNEKIKRIEQLYNEIVGKQTEFPINIELDQFFSWFSERISKKENLRDENNETQNIKSVLEKFIIKSLEHFETEKGEGKNQRKRITSYNNTDVFIGYGNGSVANTTYMVFIKYDQEIRNGIYPVILYNKASKILEVCYGESSEQKPKYKWDKTFIYNLSASKTEYKNSYVKNSFKIENEQDIKNNIDKIINDIDIVISDFHKKFNNVNDLDRDEKSRKQTTMLNNNQPLNQILYGPPGTGKTYSTKGLIDDIIKDQTITKDDIIINIIKDLSWYEIIALTIYLNKSKDKNKFSVKELSELNLIKLYYPTKEMKPINLRTSLWAQLQIHTISECENVKYTNRHEPLIFDKDENSEWALSSSGITFVETDLKEIINKINNVGNNGDIKDKYCKFVTFHQSYSYEEFIEGIRPIIDESNEEVKYEIAKGIFKKLCLEANKDKENNYVIVIDEINRGNISKIFGELITLIEEDKRIEPNGEDNFENTQVKDNELLVTLPCSKQKFGVPKNLYIIGTMNTSDRSIASVDIALRRRFRFIEKMPESKWVADFSIGFDKIFENLNNKIRILLDRDHQIGHSYFINTKYNNTKGNNNIKTLKNIWFSEILPLLNEYFYNDWDKLNLIVPGFIKPLEIPKCLKNEYEKAYKFKTIDVFENDLDFKNALLKEPIEDINEI